MLPAFLDQIILTMRFLDYKIAEGDNLLGGRSRVLLSWKRCRQSNLFTRCRNHPKNVEAPWGSCWSTIWIQIGLVRPPIVVAQAVRGILRQRYGALSMGDNATRQLQVRVKSSPIFAIARGGGLGLGLVLLRFAPVPVSEECVDKPWPMDLPCR